MSNITSKQQATEVARKALVEFADDVPFVIHDERTQEREFGWVFLYSPKAFVESGDPRHLYPGAGPLVVLRDEGATEFLTTSVPPEVAIDEFEKAWRKGERPGGPPPAGRA
jgi:hypothetical protein